MSGGAEEARSGDFMELKACCLQLLEALRNPNNKATVAALSRLHHLLRRSTSHALQPFFDYTLFPLLLLLEAAVECRSPPKDEAEDRSAVSSTVKTPHKVSDAVAESVLQCLEELLKKCHVGSVDQMAVLLKKLTNGALLSPSEAAEEFRGGIVRCFRALLLGLRSCSDDSCTCKKINGLPMLLDERNSTSPFTQPWKHEERPDECLLAFLRSESASAAVGHWLSLLLKVADVEVTRGHRGSAELRVEAFLTLRVLVAKVGSADALAFFLPGIVSQIGKVLNVSKTMISGAAGSMEAMDQAIRGLAEFLTTVLEDGANVSGLDVSVDDDSGPDLSTMRSPLAILEELRQLPGKKHDRSEIVVKGSVETAVNDTSSRSGFEGKGNSKPDVRRLHVDRTEEWVAKASAHVDRLLSATFPHLCVHPSKRVRQGTMAAIRGLLSKCNHTLKASRLMLLECLCAFVSDDDEEVSAAAQVFLLGLFSSSGKRRVERDLAEIFDRLFEKLPEAIIGGPESLALSHSRKLLVLVYFSGPGLVKDRLLQSPVTAARFFDTFALCLSPNSVFSGPLDKLLLERPSSVGYLRSITEMKATAFLAAVGPNGPEDSDGCETQNEYELPRMPPWFASFGSQKLYHTLAGILRLVSLSLAAGPQSKGGLSIVKDIPLGYLRKLVADVRKNQYADENRRSRYGRSHAGKLVRQATTAACILNEMVYGLSDRAVENMRRKFYVPKDHGRDVCDWSISADNDTRSQLIDCIGSILHEYLSPEVWDLPIEPESSRREIDVGDGDVALDVYRDNVMLHQVIIDGIGVFNLCLKTDFASSGFLHLSLYVLLEKLICSDFRIRRASDAVLRVVVAASGYQTVGHLVLANSDYVIDSVCRQLRHLDLNPRVPSVLAAVLSYIGVAHKILPLMEEPMRSISQELEIIGRHQHPDLTTPFLRAVAEIAKASRVEACSLPPQAESYRKHVKSQLSDVERETRNDSGCLSSCSNNGIDSGPAVSEAGSSPSSVGKHVERCEAIFFELKESKSYRQTVGSIFASCIAAATPLLASLKQTACLVALEIVEDGIVGLAKVEESYRHETETRKVLRQVLESYSLHDLGDTLDADDDTQENRLLPAMNKIWPFLIACIRNKNPLTSRRCAGVMSRAVRACGGDFFSRRFHTDGQHLWKLLGTSPFRKRPPVTRDEERSLVQLPYRRSLSALEDARAEVSDVKVQAAVLNMIADISGDKRSAAALEPVLGKVSGLVVGIACSGVGGLREAAVNALRGLSSMDADLVWLLLADVYYSSKNAEGSVPPPPVAGLPEVLRRLPPPPSPKSYLYVEYGGRSYGFDIDFSAVETVFKMLF